MLKTRTLVGVAFVAAAGLLFYPSTHNRYVHPIGRFCGSTRIGDSCAELTAAFESYVQTQGTSEAQFNRSTSSTTLLGGAPARTLPVLAIYDVGMFDDLQFAVRCENETVVEMACVLD